MIKRLQLLWKRQARAFKKKHDRFLPFGDYIVDRWEKARLLGFGEGSSIYDSSLVIGEVKVGLNTWIGPFTVLDGSGGSLIIGNNCSISAGVQIYTHDTVSRSLSGGKLPTEKASTRIGSNCYIGPNTIISKGVVIGDNVVIGANSLVLNNILSNTRAFGTPAKLANKTTSRLEQDID